MVVSFFPHIGITKVDPEGKSKEMGRDVAIIRILAEMAEGRWEEEVNNVRDLVDEYGKDSPEVSKAKKALPYFTTSGTFSERQKTCMIHHSGLIAIDIDRIQNPEEIRDKLSKEPTTFAAWVSCSGLGVCVVVKIDPLRHDESFYELCLNYATKYEIETDDLPTIERARFISHDPDLYINEGSEIFLPTQKESQSLRTYQPDKYHASNTKKSDQEIFDMAVHWTERHDGMSFEVGSRHNFLVHLSGKLNRLGMSFRTALEMIKENYPHFAQNPSNAVKYVYRRYESEHGRDNQFAFVSLPPHEIRSESVFQAMSPEQKMEFLQDRRHNQEKVYPPIEPVLSIERNIIASRGNLVGFTGPSKAGKSSLASGAIASFFVEDNDGDFMGFEGEYMGASGFLHIETEQSDPNWDKTMKTICKRASLDRYPENFWSYSFKGMDEKDMLAGLNVLVDAMVETYGSIHGILLDQIADFVMSINDEVSCRRLVKTLERIAKEHHTVIYYVIHEKYEGGKMRGFLGTFLEQKSESVVRAEKEKKDSPVSKVSYPWLRNAGNVPPIRFAWNVLKQYHTIAGKALSAVTNNTSGNANYRQCKSVMGAHGKRLKYSLIPDMVRAGISPSEKAAVKKLSEWEEKQWIWTFSESVMLVELVPLTEGANPELLSQSIPCDDAPF